VVRQDAPYKSYGNFTGRIENMGTKYGIVGCGYISQLYLNGFKKLGASVAHVADVDLERAKQYAREFGAKASADFHEVVQDPEVSTVVVLTHTKFHKDICLAAIQAGKNVICEKTLALSPEDGAEIARTAQKAGVFFFTAYMKRLFPAVQKAKSLLPSLGTIYSVYARSYQFWGNLYHPSADFSGELWLRNYGGGVLKCAGSHILDLIMFFFGQPTSLYGRMDWVENTHLDRNAIAMLEYPKSLTVTFEAAGHCLSRIGFQKKTGMNVLKSMEQMADWIYICRHGINRRSWRRCWFTMMKRHRLRRNIVTMRLIHSRPSWNIFINV
jgi:predicted dehydrogenase